jgi:hypothetical protein
MTKPVARDPIYRRRRFEPEIIELCVRWYLTYRLSYRDLVCRTGLCRLWWRVHRCCAALALESRRRTPHRMGFDRSDRRPDRDEHYRVGRLASVSCVHAVCRARGDFPLAHLPSQTGCVGVISRVAVCPRRMPSPVLNRIDPEAHSQG